MARPTIELAELDSGPAADLNARPVVLAPWHWRLDWQLWIAACGPNGTNDRWFLSHYSSPRERPATSSRHASVPGHRPPTHVRVSQYRYAFVEPDNGTEAVWTREPRRVLVRPVGAEALREALRT